MERWRFVDLGARDGYFIQSVYEAVAKFVGSGRSPPTLIFVYPSHPYVCIGVNQLPDLEVDTELCRKLGIPIVRRQVGGGAVYLDQNQQFYHVIVPRNHPLARGTVEDFFRNVLRAVVEFYRSYGLPAEYKPVNDVVIRGRKASGNGAALLHGSMVLIGNVILDFDAETAAKILRVPDEKLRSHLVATMKEWVTSLRRELGYVPPRHEVVIKLRKCFEDALGIELVDGELSAEELEETRRIAEKLASKEWLYALADGREDLLRRYVPGTRVVKVREGHYIAYVDHRGEKTVRIVLETVEGIVNSVIISGDFFVDPPDVLLEISKQLRGTKISEVVERSRSVVEEALSKARIVVGVKPNDIVEALRKSIEILENFATS